MAEESASEHVEFEVRGDFGQSDQFVRNSPASLEGPPEAWQFAREVIDHGCFVLRTVNQLREDRRVRDAVTSALLRRALITAEGVHQLIAHGLEEPAAQVLRTLLEIRVYLRLITQDPSDRMAKRLAAFHYSAGQRYGTSLLRDRDTRLKIEEKTGESDWIKAQAKALKEFFESAAFDEVREDVRGSQHWHGYPNTEEAYRAAGAIDDYRRIYTLYSPFVHANNIDFDFAGFEGESPALKSLPQRDPRRTLSLLGGAVLMLLDVIELFVEDRGYAGYPRSIRVRLVGTDHWEQVSPVAVLQFQAAAVFGPWIGMDDPPVVSDEPNV